MRPRILRILTSLLPLLNIVANGCRKTPANWQRSIGVARGNYSGSPRQDGQNNDIFTRPLQRGKTPCAMQGRKEHSFRLLKLLIQ
jgi:hypothetical protein